MDYTEVITGLSPSQACKLLRFAPAPQLRCLTIDIDSEVSIP